MGDVKRDAVLLWEFHLAPPEYQALSEHGGDEDGVVFVHDGVELPWWMDRLWSMYGDPDEIKVDGGTVYIWAHA